MTAPTNATPANPTDERTHRRAAATMRRVSRVIRRIPRAGRHVSSTLGGRRARPQAPAVAPTTNPNIAAAGLRLVVRYQWLVSGVDKLLLGTFPGQMGQLLAGQISGGKLPAYFAALLRALVVPNAPVFGYMVMLGETLAGLGLIAAGLFTLIRPLAEARARGSAWNIFARADRLVMGLAPAAAVGAGLLGLSYYLLDGAPTLWFTPSLAYRGAIAPGMLVALASLVLVVAQVFPVRTTHH